MEKKYNFVFFANASKGIVSIKTIIKLNNYNKIFIFSQKEDSWESKYINKLKNLQSKKIKLFVIKDFSFKNVPQGCPQFFLPHRSHFLKTIGIAPRLGYISGSTPIDIQKRYSRSNVPHVFASLTEHAKKLT